MIKKIINQYLIPLLLLIVSSVSAHEGEPSHGGDLPVDLGGNPMQYEGGVQTVVKIVIQNKLVEPREVTIDISGIIAFQNTDSMTHNVIFSMGEAEEEHDHPAGGHERSKIVKPGDYWVLQFLVPGLFPYQCSIHGESGQVYVRY